MPTIFKSITKAFCRNCKAPFVIAYTVEGLLSPPSPTSTLKLKCPDCGVNTEVVVKSSHWQNNHRVNREATRHAA